MIVAIDGPAGTGKSSVAREVAHKLGFIYLDTGAMYRALTWLTLHNSINLQDEVAIAALALENPISFKEGGVVRIGNTDVTGKIRTAEVDEAVVQVARLPKVRQILVAAQQEYGQNNNVVTEGRDTTTVVFPEAEFKFYLTADERTRALRRYLQTRSTNNQRIDEITLHKIQSHIKNRDEMDSSRDEAPLRKADDAIEIDTTDLTFREVVQAVIIYCTPKHGKF